MQHDNLWQFVNEMWLSCHSWQESAIRSVSAMVLLILLGILSLVAMLFTILELRVDGYRRRPTAAIRRQADPERWH